MKNSAWQKQLVDERPHGLARTGFIWLRKVLAITPNQKDQNFLRDLLEHYGWNLQKAHTCCEALKLLSLDPPPVLICESRLPDGTWLEILSQSVVLPDSPRVIVAAPTIDDRLRAHIIKMGAYNVLSKPLDRNEVLCTVSTAWRDWQTALHGDYYMTQVA
jgi:DNA-binding NtrC family response regulator